MDSIRVPDRANPRKPLALKASPDPDVYLACRPDAARGETVPSPQALPRRLRFFNLSRLECAAAAAPAGADFPRHPIDDRPGRGRPRVRGDPERAHETDHHRLRRHLEPARRRASDQRGKARPRRAAGGAGRRRTGDLPPRRGGQRPRHRLAGARDRPGARRAARARALGEHRRRLPIPRFRLCAGRRDLPVRLLARRLHRALAGRADPQLRHPRARACRRRSRRRWRSTARVRPRPGRTATPPAPSAPAMRRTSPPAGPRSAGGRRAGCRQERRSGSPIWASGTRWGRSGCPATCGWRRSPIGASPSTTPRCRAGCGRRGTRWRSTSSGGPSRLRSGTTSPC